jgi:hypothetical protein
VTALVSQGLEGIFDTLADAIEGGTTWRGSGTAFKGIPGKYSNDLRLADDSPLTVSAAVSASAFKVATLWRSDRWVTLNGAAYWVLDHHAEHRKVTAYNATTGQFTVGTAFSNAPQVADTLTVLQGFKRLPNGIDIETAEGAAEGFDRSFHLEADAGKRTEWSGSGDWLLETVLRLRVRFLKFGRLHDWVASAMTNMAILRAGLARTIHYETTYMRALIPDGTVRVVHDDNNKLVTEDAFRLFYRLDTSFT